MGDFPEEDIDSYLRMEEENQVDEEDYLQYMEEEGEPHGDNIANHETKASDTLHDAASSVPKSLPKGRGETRSLGVEETKADTVPELSARAALNEASLPPLPQNKRRRISDFSLRLQSERRAIFGERLSPLPPPPVSCLDPPHLVLVTKNEYPTKIENSQDCLHVFPVSYDNYEKDSTITLHNNKRFFLHPRHRHSSAPGGASDTAGRDLGLLARPFAEVQQEVDDLRRKEILSAMASTNAQTNSPPRKSSALQGSGGELWVDKYAPRSFMHLLSPEHVNRAFLQALKRWDPFVFKKATGDPNAAEVSDTRPQKKLIMLAGPPGSGKTSLANICASLSGYLPLSLSALDTSTLDTIQGVMGGQSLGGAMYSSFAPHASASSHTSNGNAPSCVILEDLDVEGGRGVGEALMRMVNMSLTSGSGGARKKRATNSSTNTSGGNNPLLRPVIIIVSDLYTPSLRDIKKYAEVFTLPHLAPPARTNLAGGGPAVGGDAGMRKVVARLANICKEEGLSAGTTLLSQLVSQNAGDIRACLNALQFMATSHREVREGEGWGVKDSLPDPITSLRMLLHHTSLPSRYSSGGSSSHGGLFSYLLDLVSVCGGEGGVAAGLSLIHTNAHLVLDGALARGAGFYESLSKGDLLLAHAWATGAGAGGEGGVSTLAASTIAPLVYFYYSGGGMMSGGVAGAPAWPRRDKEVSFLATQKMQVCREVQAGFTKARPCSTEMFLEVCPYLVNLLSPPSPPLIRPVPLHSLNPKEVDLAKAVANLAVSLHFTLTPRPVPPTFTPNNGHPSHSLANASNNPHLTTLTWDPPLHQMVLAGEKRMGGMAEEVKEVILHLMRVAEREGKTRELTEEVPSSLPVKAAPAIVPAAAVATVGVPIIPPDSHPAPPPSSIDEDSSSKKSKGFSSFFLPPKPNKSDVNKAGGLFGASSAKSTTPNPTSATKATSASPAPLYFKFREGYSNAVKRGVGVGDFLRSIYSNKQ